MTYSKYILSNNYVSDPAVSPRDSDNRLYVTLNGYGNCEIQTLSIPV